MPVSTHATLLPPAILRNNGQVEAPDLADLVIGVMPDIKFNVFSVTLEKNESIYLFTDGISEAENEATEQFGEQRFYDFLKENAHEKPEIVCNKIRIVLDKYRGKAVQSDDITVLGFKYL